MNFSKPINQLPAEPTENDVCVSAELIWSIERGRRELVQPDLEEAPALSIDWKRLEALARRPTPFERLHAAIHRVDDTTLALLLGIVLVAVTVAISAIQHWAFRQFETMPRSQLLYIVCILFAAYGALVLLLTFCIYLSLQRRRWTADKTHFKTASAEQRQNLQRFELTRAFCDLYLDCLHDYDRRGSQTRPVIYCRGNDADFLQTLLQAYQEAASEIPVIENRSFNRAFPTLVNAHLRSRVPSQRLETDDRYQRAQSKDAGRRIIDFVPGEAFCDEATSVCAQG